MFIPLHKRSVYRHDQQPLLSPQNRALHQMLDVLNHLPAAARHPWPGCISILFLAHAPHALIHSKFFHCCVVLQVPLHVGVAVSAAAQHSCKSPGTNAALSVLATLLNTAHLSGLVKDGAAAGNLAISMRQQLQQAGVLQHLTTVMAAMAADLDSQATELTAQYEDYELGSGLEPPVLGNISELCCTLQRQAAVMKCLRRLLLSLRQLWSSPGVSTQRVHPIVQEASQKGESKYRCCVPKQ